MVFSTWYTQIRVLQTMISGIRLVSESLRPPTPGARVALNTLKEEVTLTRGHGPHTNVYIYIYIYLHMITCVHIHTVLRVD